MGRSCARHDRRRRVLLPVAAAGDSDGDHDLPRPVRPVERHLRLRHLHHRGLYSAILPYHPCRSDPHQGIRVRGIRPRGRRLHVAHHDQAPVQELHTNPAGHPDAELLRSHPDPCGPGLPGLRHRTDRGRRMGIRPQPRRLRCDRRHLVDRRVPGSGHRAHRAGHHPGGRIAERSG